MTKEKPENRGFQAGAERVLQRVRRALTSLVHSIPGETVARPAELAEVLQLDNGLAWKISKAIEGDDPFRVAHHLPGNRGVQILLRAAKRKRVPITCIEETQLAFDELRAFVRAHAGDRKSFDMLTTGQARTRRGEADLTHRRGAFEHLRYVFGVHAKAQIRTYMVYPSADARSIDVVSIVGYLDVRRIRASVPWRITSLHTIDVTGTVRTDFDREPLDPVGLETHQGLPIVRRFCSDPLPAFRVKRRANGLVDHLLDDDRLGNTSLFTCFTAERVRAAEPRFPDAAHKDAAVLARVRTPCAMLLFDWIVHRDLFGTIRPAASMYSDVFMRDPAEGLEESDRVPLHERPESLGTGTSGLAVAGVPRYPELIEFVLERLGWNGDDFETHRLTIGFPPIPCSVVMSHPLKPRNR
jgi:hypothetical protein